MARYVLSGLQSGDYLLGVLVGRCKQLHRVDARIGQHLFIARIELRRDLPLPGASLCPVSFRIAQRHDFAHRMLEVARNVEL